MKKKIQQPNVWIITISSTEDLFVIEKKMQSTELDPHHAHLFRQTKIRNILDSLGGLWFATSCGLVCVLMYVMLDWWQLNRGNPLPLLRDGVTWWHVYLGAFRGFSGQKSN